MSAFFGYNDVTEHLEIEYNEEWLDSNVTASTIVSFSPLKVAWFHLNCITNYLQSSFWGNDCCAPEINPVKVETKFKGKLKGGKRVLFLSMEHYKDSKIWYILVLPYKFFSSLVLWEGMTSQAKVPIQSCKDWTNLSLHLKLIKNGPWT